MISVTIIDNLESWVTQVFLIASLGMLLPFIFRIRHPRSQLVYCHLLLAACVFLPLIQPWQHQQVVVTSPSPTAGGESPPPFIKPATPAAGIPWDALALGIIGSGIVVRLCWTAVGVWKLRQHKLAAMPLHPVLESVREAIERTNVDVPFSVSSTGIGPVTFGF